MVALLRQNAGMDNDTGAVDGQAREVQELPALTLDAPGPGRSMMSPSWIMLSTNRTGSLA